MSGEQAQDSVSDVERLREALVWADLKIRSFPSADQSDVEFIRAALAVPINKIGEDASEVDRLRKIVRDTLWMACRYAHGRQSYAVAMYNEAARDAEALDVLPKVQEPHFAIDGSNSREMSGLTQPEFNQAWRGWHGDDAIPNHCRKDW